MANFWAWLDGKKTVIGAIITIIGGIADQLSTILPTLVEPSKATEIVGVITLVVGGLHKLYKFYYKE